MHSRAFVVRVPHAACPVMGVQVVVMQDTLLKGVSKLERKVAKL